MRSGKHHTFLSKPMRTLTLEQPPKHPKLMRLETLNSAGPLFTGFEPTVRGMKKRVFVGKAGWGLGQWRAKGLRLRRGFLYFASIFFFF